MGDAPGILPQRLAVWLQGHDKVLDGVGRQHHELGAGVSKRRQRWRKGRVDGDDVRPDVFDNVHDRLHNLHKLGARPGKHDLEKHHHPPDCIKEADHVDDGETLSFRGDFRA